MALLNWNLTPPPAAYIYGARYAEVTVDFLAYRTVRVPRKIAGLSFCSILLRMRQ